MISLITSSTTDLSTLKTRSRRVRNRVIVWLLYLQLPMQSMPGTPVSSTNKIDRHDITEILLKVALNTIIITPLKPNLA